MSLPTTSTPAADLSTATARRTDTRSRRGSVENPNPSTKSRVDMKGSRSSLFQLLMYLLLLAASLPFLVSLFLYEALQSDTVDLPLEWISDPIDGYHAYAIRFVDRLADGLTPGPEDFAYDARSGTLYTGCLDGWIRRERLDEDAAVDKWAYVGDRPMGIALAPLEPGRPMKLYVANAEFGLMAVDDSSSPPMVTLLADERYGMRRFALATGVDVAANGMVYYTDTSWKYSLARRMGDDLEGREPNGRLLRYDPGSNSTEVLLDGIYFSNGVAVEPLGEFLVFCEKPMSRCMRYYLNGEKRGQTEVFVDNLPGLPENIYCGDGNGTSTGGGLFFIATTSDKNWACDVLLRYGWMHKLASMAGKYVHVPKFMAKVGIMEVGLNGTAISFWYDQRLPHVTVGFQVGDHLYLGYLTENYIGRTRIIYPWV